MLQNPNFYPTPTPLIARMCAKVQNREPRAILEPSAGKGDIIEYIGNSRHFICRSHTIAAIEKDPDLFATLQGKDIRVIDRDFLEYSGGDIFDLILMNPPFDEGEKHLLKAMDILYAGEIVCLLNAQTLRNPHTEARKTLCKRLEEAGAEVEYIADAFKDAERKTGVEIALIYIKIERTIENDLFAGASDTTQEENITLEEQEEANIAINDPVESLVREYRQQREIGLKTLLDYYKNYSKIGTFIELSVNNTKCSGALATSLQSHVNDFNQKLRKSYWNKALNLRVINERMTSENRKRFHVQLGAHAHLDFTASNIRSFILNLIGSYEQTLIDAVVKLFDDFTHKYSYWAECDRNRLHFSTWKTNEAFKVASKVITPHYASYGNPFYGYSGLKLDYKVRDYLDDLDKVLNYIAGHSDYIKASQAIESYMDAKNKEEEPAPIESSFFSKIAFYKKGTLHLTFRDSGLLRKFNVIACQGKGWLPDDYGRKKYEDYANRDKEVVDSFEGESSYKQQMHNPPSFVKSGQELLLLSCA